MPSLKFNPRDNIIVVQAKIWGSLVTTARLVLDTGASTVIIPQRIATALDLKINPKQLVQTTTATKVESVPQVNIPKMSVLGLEVKNVEALVKDLPPESRVDGLLGLSFLRHFKLEIDFKRGQLVLQYYLENSVK